MKERKDEHTPQKSSIKRRPEQEVGSKNNELKAGDILNFSSTISVILVSAIFYMAGWVYLAHWYSYFGIQASQVTIPTQTVVIHGVPSMLVLIISGLIPSIFLAINKMHSKTERLNTRDIPKIIIGAYLIALMLLSIILGAFRASTHASYSSDFPVEVYISVLLFFLLAAMAILMSLKNQANEERLVLTITETWQFWLGAFLVLYFLISVSFSALFGKWDAMRGGSFMVGNWSIPEVVVFSDKPIPSLMIVGSPIRDGYAYLNLGLLASDSQAYYLVKLKSEQYYDIMPSVFIVPRSSDVNLSMITNPYAFSGYPEFLDYYFITPTPTMTAVSTSSAIKDIPSITLTSEQEAIQVATPTP